MLDCDIEVSVFELKLRSPVPDNAYHFAFSSPIKNLKILIAWAGKIQDSVGCVNNRPLPNQWMAFLFLKWKKHETFDKEYSYTCSRNLRLFERELVKLLDYEMITMFFRNTLYKGSSKSPKPYPERRAITEHYYYGTSVPLLVKLEKLIQIFLFSKSSRPYPERRAIT